MVDGKVGWNQRGRCLTLGAGDEREEEDGKFL